MFVKQILLSLIVLGMNNDIFADEELAVGIPVEGYPPYIIIDDNGIHGILIESLEKAAKASYIQIHYELLDEVESISKLDKKEIDCRMESPGWVDNPNDYLWSEPITSIKDMFVFNRKTPNVFESNVSLEKSIINSHVGYSYPTIQYLIDQNKVIRRDFMTEYAMLSDLLIESSYLPKAAVMDKNVIEYLMDKNSEFRSELMISKRHIDYKYLHFQFSKTTRLERMVNQLNLQLKKMKMKGEIDKIIKSNLGD